MIGALTAVTPALAGPTAPATAGTYRVAQCHADFDVGPADVRFGRTSTHYKAESACGPGNGGLSVTHEAHHTNGGRWGAWTATVPAGTELVRASASVKGKRRGGHSPQLLVGPLDGLVPFGSAAGAFHRVAWSGRGARALRAALVCTARQRCGPAPEAHIRIRRLMLRLFDARPPSLDATGSLLAGRSRRGDQTIRASASDAGGGVHRAFVQVNGDPVAGGPLGCALDGKVALRLRPCPAHVQPVFTASTAQPPFRQGPNSVRVCAADYAPDTGANRDCETNRVRVDNACPVSGVAAGTRLRAHVRRGKRGPRPYGSRFVVVGRLLDSANHPVPGAEVCIATRAHIPGVRERIVATPTTGPAGRFAVRLPAGPNRQLRVAHWPSAAGAVERFGALRVRTRPRLKLLPGGVLHNGERVRFRVRLPGPRAAGRHIALKVRANGRWLPLRRGATNRHGVWTGSYRFRATTGRETYRFRAFAPKQRGYPFQRGRSKIKRQTVVG
jgi:hypothetical protein